MKINRLHLKPVAWLVLLTFLALLHASSSPLPATTSEASETNGSELSAPAADSGVIEREQEPESRVEHKKFPWLIVLGLAVLGGAAILYFVVLNKKYTLTVTVGEGVTGTPTAGSVKYKKNKTISYNFSLQSGYKDLVVTLDGAAVAASGTVKMDKDHALSATSSKVAVVAVNSTPTGAKIYDNDADTGYLTNHVYYYASAGTHKYRLRKCGFQDFVSSVDAEMGVQKTLAATLLEGIWEKFIVPASSCWAPHTPGAWSVTGGYYRFADQTTEFNYNVYDTEFEQDGYTATAKMERIQGGAEDDNALLLAESIAGNIAYGYWFAYTANGTAYIIRMEGYNVVNGGGTFTTILSNNSAAIVQGLGAWNTLEVTREDNTYSFTINGTLVHSFSDSTYDPGLLTLGMIVDNVNTEIRYDYVKLDIEGSTVLRTHQPIAKPLIARDWPGKRY